MTEKTTLVSTVQKQERLFDVTFNWQYLDGETVLLDRTFVLEYSQPSEKQLVEPPEGITLDSPERLKARLKVLTDLEIEKYNSENPDEQTKEQKEQALADEINNLLN